MSFPSELAIYVGRVRTFERTDWLVYGAWIGLMLGLVLASGGFLLFGHRHGVRFPAEAWLVPLGAALFTGAIAIDTIGHRTVYRTVLRDEAEGMVHAITIACGVASCILLCAAYGGSALVWIPALVLTALSMLYSLVDEELHWRRYLRGRSDRVEMTSHVGILFGHGTMMLGWWLWFFRGYSGVAETLRVLTG
jgi:hypothetical protein